MRLASLSFIASLVATTIPLILAGANGPTFCQSVDKLKITSPLTFIRPVPSVTLKWNPKICLCQADGQLTDSTVAQLEAKIAKDGRAKLAKQLGLDTLPDNWEELFVEQAVMNAAEAFLDQYKTCPRGCVYPKGSIPNSCADCGYDCPKGQQKCNNKCQASNKPCASKTPKPPKTTKTGQQTDTTSEGYPTWRKRHLTVTADEAAATPVPAPAHRFHVNWEESPVVPTDTWTPEALPVGTATTWAVSDIPEPTLIQQYYRSTNTDKCEPGWIPCAVNRKRKADWECTDVMNMLDSCGGCIYPILPGPVGASCSDETGADEVACVQGHCKIKSCQRGFAHNGTACAPLSHKRYSLE